MCKQQYNVHKPTKPFIPIASNASGRLSIRRLPVVTPPLVKRIRRSKSGQVIS